MPFKKGNKLAKGFGRKGYQYEQDELKRMRTLYRKGLTLMEKMIDGKATIKEEMAYGNVEKAILKIMDKFHATKQEVALGADETIGGIKIEIVKGKDDIPEVKSDISVRQELGGVPEQEPPANN